MIILKSLTKKPLRQQKKMTNKLVAIVDDDILYAEKLSDRLKEYDFETIIVSSGLELLSVLSIDHPEIIIIDAMLSWIDSKELIRVLRQNSSFEDIKVFLITEKNTDKISKNNDIEIFHKLTAIDSLLKRIAEEKDNNETSG